MATDWSASQGVVYLVGAGPGDPGLITVRGLDCLRRATVVVYDSLVNPRLLAEASSTADLIAVGKRHGQPCPTQDAINEILVSKARAGANVVRLKGGDPFVFGRGGEEAAALSAAGIRFEIVSGVTAGVAATAAAGIPVTHRQLASAVTFITAHEGACKSDEKLDWAALARVPGTLVMYMGVTQIARVVEMLVQNGKPVDTPIAVIEWGTTPSQHTTVGTLTDIVERATNAQVKSPAVIVVGAVVSLSDTLRWLEHRPLFGRRIVVTRPAHQATDMVARLDSLGAEVLLLPALRVEPPQDWSQVDQAITRLSVYGWIVFTSSNGVKFFFERLFELGHDSRLLGRLRIATIGTSTATALTPFGVRADLIPASADSESLVAAFLGQSIVPGQASRLLLVRADRRRETLADGLESAGVAYDEIEVYRHLDNTEWDAAVVARIEGGEADWLTVTSPETIRSLMRHLSRAAQDQIRGRTKLASISPLTSAAVREHGLVVSAEASVPNAYALIDAIVAAEPSVPSQARQPSI